ncbi:hypothetical protein Csa_010569 [Cucumis sativus]|uniref:Secreted protein n=1 Tax=Cucumis sativus TaxID=3659 RepID=A0A0A0L6L1_CUCSA|nr:hypothetical protein Csa_010569 [Cucumis sativus]
MLANHHTTCCWAWLLYFYPVPHTLALTQSSSHIFASFLYLPLICLIFHSPSPSIKFSRKLRRFENGKREMEMHETKHKIRSAAETQKAKETQSNICVAKNC